MKNIYATLTTIILVMGLFTLSFSQSPKNIEVKVNGLVCAFCAQGITSTFSKEPATEDVYVSLEDQLVAIALKPDMDMDDTHVTKTLVDAGYDVVSMERTDRSLAIIKEGASKHASEGVHYHQPHHE